jgi:hypothetical protein
MPTLESLRLCVCEAIKAYKAECARFGITKFDEDILKAAVELQEASQCTVLECHLCRTLAKPESEHAAGCTKYLGLYATVASKLVLPQLWDAAQKAMKPPNSKAACKKK